MEVRDKLPFQLLPGERALLVTRPHPLSMATLVVFWALLAALGAAHLRLREPLTALVQDRLSIPLVGEGAASFLARHAQDLAWFASLLIPLVIMAIFRVNFGYVLTLMALLLGNVLLRWKVAPRLELPPGRYHHLENYLLIGVGLLGVVGVELFRRGHRYYLTDRRIVARFGTLRISERSTLYSKIDDLLLQSGLLGRLLNFGTVLPITSTGLGMGQDLALAGAAAGAGGGASVAGLGAGLFAGGGKAKNVPRELSLYVLYRIPNPERARNTILHEMEARERPRREAAAGSGSGDASGSRGS